PLAFAEMRLAIARENLRHRKARGLFYGFVGVDEIEAETPRKPTPDRGFPSPHQPHEHHGAADAAAARSAPSGLVFWFASVHRTRYTQPPRRRPSALRRARACSGTKPTR